MFSWGAMWTKWRYEKEEQNGANDLSVTLQNKPDTFVTQNGENIYLLSLIHLTKRQILDYSKPKEFADDNFKFDENGRKLTKRVEKTVGKGEIASDVQFLLFPQCFLQICTVDT